MPVRSTSRGRGAKSRTTPARPARKITGPKATPTTKAPAKGRPEAAKIARRAIPLSTPTPPSRSSRGRAVAKSARGRRTGPGSKLQKNAALSLPNAGPALPAVAGMVDAFRVSGRKATKRSYWTEAEVEALQAGVKKFGEGHWTLMKQDQAEILKNRSSMDLKDKWRNMTKAAAKGSSNAGKGAGKREDHFRSERKKQRQFWTPLETHALEAGVLRFGVGNWAEIKRQAGDIFANRTTLDIKDKWRNLQKKRGSQARNKGKFTQHFREDKKKKRVFWTEDELKALIEGVQKCGEGNWTAIKREYPQILVNRTTIDLKDKWRNKKDKTNEQWLLETQRKGRDHFRDQKKTTRNYWTEVELQGLIDGVNEFGHGKWSRIKRSRPDLFANRTTLDLKDKWRTKQDKSFEEWIAETKRKRSEHFRPERKTTKNFWTQQEVQALLVGCEAYGEGKWALIKRANPKLFENRTTLDIKDKWRNMKKHGGLEEYRKSGSISAFPFRAGKEDRGQKRAAPSAAHAPPSKKRAKTPWTANEVIALQAGVNEFGVGRWADIKRMYPEVLANRTSMDIKDKWRTYSKRAPQISHMGF